MAIIDRIELIDLPEPEIDLSPSTFLPVVYVDPEAVHTLVEDFRPRLDDIISRRPTVGSKLLSYIRELKEDYNPVTSFREFVKDISECTRQQYLYFAFVSALAISAVAVMVKSGELTQGVSTDANFTAPGLNQPHPKHHLKERKEELAPASSSSILGFSDTQQAFGGKSWMTVLSGYKSKHRNAGHHHGFTHHFPTTTPTKSSN